MAPMTIDSKPLLIVPPIYFLLAVVGFGAMMGSFVVIVTGLEGKIAAALILVFMVVAAIPWFELEREAGGEAL